MTWISYHRDNDIGLEDMAAAFGFLLLMIYFFIGIAFASDIFMNAIERICGATTTKTITKEELGVVVKNTKTIQIWNDTVANLSLMAVGSSGPEIFLSVIETLEGLGQQNPGDLGPGTIVGSAAVNLMVITAVCIVSLVDGRTSRIKLYNVFGFTAFTSLFAYIWMVIVLEWNSKDEVDIWEGLVTLGFFPVLVFMSYWVDQNCCMPWKKGRASTLSTASQEGGEEDRNFHFGDDTDDLYDKDGELNKSALQNLYGTLTRMAELTPNEITLIIATKLIQGKQHSRTWYRSQMTRTLMGGAKLLPVLNEKLKEVADAIGETRGDGHIVDKESRKTILTQVPTTRPSTFGKKAVVEFEAATMAVDEGIGEAVIEIMRSGRDDLGFEVNVETYDGNAKGGVQYEAVKTTVKFDPYVMECEVKVGIKDNAEWNLDSNFFVKLSIKPEFADKAALGQTKMIEIIIREYEKPGRVTFKKRGYVFEPQGVISVDVERVAGTDGTISVQWKVIPGPECEIVKEQTGSLEFKLEEVRKFIEVNMKESAEPSGVDGDKEKFDIELSDPKGGAKLGKYPKTTVAISGKTGFKLEINENVLQAAIQLSEDADEEQSYSDQIMNSFKVNGGDSSTATSIDYLLHIMNFPYKVIFSLIPPTSIMGGWAAFILALGAVGILTKVVGETASAFGNALGMDPVITAITFVALGTSLPDLFASRISAMNDATADNAVGNVTGSNSVNVFLGLGIPWSIGAIYYKYFEVKGQQPYCVPAGPLTFNVLVYTICAAMTIGILTFRRWSPSCGRAELGGPHTMKWITSVVMMALWCVYICLSSAQVILVNTKGVDISSPFVGKQNEICNKLIAESKISRAQKK